MKGHLKYRLLSVKSRIVGGTFANQGTWPWAVVLGKPSGSSFQVLYMYSTRTTGVHLSIRVGTTFAVLVWTVPTVYTY